MVPKGWPLVFAAQDIQGLKFFVAAGAIMPFQDKITIRGIARGLGIKDADTMPFGDLPCIRILDVQNAQQEKAIRDAQMSYDQASAITARGAAVAPSPADPPPPPRRRGRPPKIKAETQAEETHG